MLKQPRLATSQNVWSLTLILPPSKMDLSMKGSFLTGVLWWSKWQWSGRRLWSECQQLMWFSDSQTLPARWSLDYLNNSTKWRDGCIQETIKGCSHVEYCKVILFFRIPLLILIHTWLAFNCPCYCMAGIYSWRKKQRMPFLNQFSGKKSEFVIFRNSSFLDDVAAVEECEPPDMASIGVLVLTMVQNIFYHIFC